MRLVTPTTYSRFNLTGKKYILPHRATQTSVHSLRLSDLPTDILLPPMLNNFTSSEPHDLFYYFVTHDDVPHRAGS